MFDALDYSITLQFAKLLCEHALGDFRDAAFEGVEPEWTLFLKVEDDRGFPLTAKDPENFLDRAGAFVGGTFYHDSSGCGYKIVPD